AWWPVLRGCHAPVRSRREVRVGRPGRGLRDRGLVLRPGGSPVGVGSGRHPRRLLRPAAPAREAVCGARVGGPRGRCVSRAQAARGARPLSVAVRAAAAYPALPPPAGGEAVSWEEEARNWIAWARTPGHDAYWDYSPRFFELVPPPDRAT